jgi:hypothetical protein
MKARDLFRAPIGLKLRDGHAGKQLLGGGDKEEDKQETERLIARIAELQAMLYAQRKHKVLLVLQGMDTAGKDGTVRALFSQVNPIGIRVQAFKAPTDIELAHDYLWRVHQQVPVKGEVAIFNRSHYEDVLVPRVLGDIDSRECKRRYAQIHDFERMLAENGTVIAAPAPAGTHRRSGQELEIRSTRHQAACPMGRFPARLRTRNRGHQHRACALVRGAGRFEDAAQPGHRHHPAGDAGGAQAGLAARRSGAERHADQIGRQPGGKGATRARRLWHS